MKFFEMIKFYFGWSSKEPKKPCRRCIFLTVVRGGYNCTLPVNKRSDINPFYETCGHFTPKQGAE